MANNRPQTVTHWVLIIGINYYPGEAVPDLRGCINDAEAVRSYHEEMMGDRSDIKVLTSSTPPTPGGYPTEDPKLWPTFDNVVDHLKRIIRKAREGHSVYIHFSGHGGPEFSLALLNDGSSNENPLKRLMGDHISNALRAMVDENKVFVTLVLDCCFSGGIQRGNDDCGFQVRSFEYDDISDPFDSHEQKSPFGDNSNAFRDASTDRDWIVEPDGYTVLTACDPDQIAMEITTESGERRGALTFFLMRALYSLRMKDVKLTHQSLHEHLSTMFHSFHPLQTPMRYGNPNRSIFGEHLLAPENGLIQIYYSNDHGLCLRAGEIHGVFKDDEYVAYPFETPEHARGQVEKGTPNVKVTKVGLFESEIVEIGSNTIVGQELDMVGVDSKAITSGHMSAVWKARPLTSRSPRKTSFGILPSFESHFENISQEDFRFVRFVTKEAEDHEPEDICTYNIGMNANDEYEILDAHQERISTIPSIRQNPDGLKNLANVVQHMAKFKYFEGMENEMPCQSFLRSVSIASNMESGNDNIIEIEHGAEWTLKVTNKRDKALYLAIFDFKPSWAVNSVFPNRPYRIIKPSGNKEQNRTTGIWEKGLKMSVPSSIIDKGKTECEDTIKVFVTSSATSFQVHLPDICKTANGELGVLRGDSQDFTDLLAGLNNITMRGEEDGGWTTKKFIIRTKKQN